MKSIRKLFSFWPFSLIVSAILSTAPFFFMKIYYMYGDDYLMNYIANGSYGIENSDHLVFPRMLFGTAAKFLYGLNRNINWYCVLLTASIALAYSVFHWILAKLSENYFAIAVSIAMNAITVPYLLTFTTSAFLCVAAGAALLYYGILQNKSFRYLLFGSVLALWGYVIRNDTLIPGFAVMAPIALKFVIDLVRSDRKEKLKYFARSMFKLAVTGFFCLVVLLVFRRWEHEAYSSDIWKEFKVYNLCRSEAVDYPGVSYEDFREGYTAIGYTPEQYTMLYRWSFAEKDVFSAEHFLEIANVTKNAYSVGWRKNYTLSVFSSTTNLLIIVIPMLLFLMMALIDSGFDKLIGLLTVLDLTAVLTALCFIRMRFLLRVSIPLSIITVFSVLLCTQFAPRKKQLITAAISSMIIIAAFLVFNKGFQKTVYSLRDPAIAESAQASLDEVREHPERTYIAESYAFSRMYYYGHSVDEVVPIDDYQHLLRSGSWDSFSERYYSLADKIGIDDPDNLLSSLLADDDIYLISENGGFIKNFLQSIHPEKTIEMESTPIGDGKLNLIKFNCS